MVAQKRAASPTAVHDEPLRRSRRISSTSRKSLYFEDAEDDDPEDSNVGYQDQNSGDEEDNCRAEEDHLRNKQVKGAGGRHSAKVAMSEAKRNDRMKRVKTTERKRGFAVEEDDYKTAGKEEEDSDEGSDDEDMPPRVTIVPLERLRPLDGFEYEDDKIHKNTLLFLADLKVNNVRSWLKSHDGEYRRALQDWNTFVGSLTPKIIDVDFTIPDLPAKDVVFRIHRDIRFSKDPTPYKPHFSAAWSRTGRKGPYACYYVHVEPGGHCFVGGGLWHPPGEQLQLLRESIDERPARWRRILNDNQFRRVFLDSKIKTEKGKKYGGTDDAEAAVAAFAAANQENALKTKPKGYLADHRDIELLKLRNFTVGVKIEDTTFTEDNAQDKLVGIIQAMEPFVTFLNRIVMPDLNENDDDSDEDEDDSEGVNGDAVDGDEADG